jgi:hypothetical protein
LAPVNRGPLAAEAMTPMSYDIDFLLARSVEDLAAKTAAHGDLWGFGEEDNWALDQDVGEIVFSFADGKVARASAQIIGTINTLDGTWLWSWANPSIEPSLTRHAVGLRTYGEEHGIQFLTERKCPASQERAWQLTALSGYMNGAQGAYRGPVGTALVFMTFGEIRLSQEGGG